jgi:tetratricopeptide (TPR) repeat protein
MARTPNEGTSKGKKPISRRRLPDELAQDPTSIFFAAVRHTQPEALAELARICQMQTRLAPEVAPAVVSEHDKGTVLQAMELLRTGQSAAPVIGELVDSSEFETAEYPALLPSGHHAPGLKSGRIIADEDVPKEESPVPIDLDAPAEEEAETIELEAPPIGDEPEASIHKLKLSDAVETESEAEPIELELSEADLDAEFEPVMHDLSESKAEAELGDEVETNGCAETSGEALGVAEAANAEMNAEGVEQATAVEETYELGQLEDFTPESDVIPAKSNEESKSFETVAALNVDEATDNPATTDAGSAIDEATDQISEAAQKDLPAKSGPVKKAPLRIEAAPPSPKSEIKRISEPAIESIPGAFDKGINDEFKGVYEKAIQRGSVFDAKHRDAFSSESEKKVRSSYLGLKAITFEEALTQQEEKDPSILRSQSQNMITLELPASPTEKAQAVWAVVDKLHTTPVIITASIICLAFLGFFIGGLCQGEGLLQEGEKLFQAKKYNEAIKVLSSSITLNPMRAHTLFVRGRAYNKIGEQSKAIDDFTRSLSINPNNIDALDHRASCYMKSGKFDNALADYRRIFELQPNEQAAYRYNNAAFAACRGGKFDDAMAFYDKALKVSPADPNALIGKAQCEVGLGHYGKAIVLCEEIIEKDPNPDEAIVTRGWCYMLLKRYDLALADFNRVIASNPKNAKALFNRGLLAFNRGDLVQALKDYNAAIAVDSNFTEARVARGWATINTNPQVALSDFRQATNSAQFGRKVEIWTARADLESQLGKKREAANLYRKAIGLAVSLDPTTLPQLYVKTASVLNDLKQYNEAIEVSNKALSIDAQNPLALTNRGRANDGLGNHISALADFSAALASSPTTADALWYRAQHYNKAREFHSAEKDLKDYISLRPGDKSALKMLASVSGRIQHVSAIAETELERKSRKYRGTPFEQLVTSGIKELNSGHTETAAEMLQEAVRKNPSDVTARRYLCHALVREDPRSSVIQFDILRAAISLPPDDERSYRHALSLAATGSLVESAAIDKALKTVAEEPGNMQACYKLSTLYAAAGILSKAAHYCQTGMATAKNPAETKKFQDLYNRLNKQNIEGEHKEDIEG